MLKLLDINQSMIIINQLKLLSKVLDQQIPKFCSVVYPSKINEKKFKIKIFPMNLKPLKQQNELNDYIHT